MISVVVPVLDGERVISRQLAALAAQRDPGMPWEVIVVDNGSSDRTVEVARSFAESLPRLRVLVARDVRGAAHARNRGVEESDGAYIAFADADDEVEPRWLLAVARALEVSDVVGPRLDFDSLNADLPGGGGQTIQHQDALPALWFPPYLRCGAMQGLGVRRVVHERVGGFDESLLRLQDVDYCIRIQHAGYLPPGVRTRRRRPRVGAHHALACLQAGLRLGEGTRRTVREVRHGGSGGCSGDSRVPSDIAQRPCSHVTEVVPSLPR